MKCCKQVQPSNKGESNQEQHSCGHGLKHMLMMLACCMAPLGAILILKQIGYEGAGDYLLLLLCPLMHLFMMRGNKDQEPASDHNTIK